METESKVAEQTTAAATTTKPKKPSKKPARVLARKAKAKPAAAKALTAAEEAEVVREVKARREKEADKDGKLPKGAVRKIYTAVAEAHGTKRRVVRRLVNVAARAVAAKKK